MPGGSTTLAVGRQPPGKEIEENYKRAGQEQRRYERQPDHKDIDAAVVGDPGGDAHDLGVAPVDQKTIGQSSLRFQAMREVALLTNSIAVMNAAVRAVAVSVTGAKVANIGEIPFVCETHHWAPRSYQCRGRAKLDLSNDFSARVESKAAVG
jgi:hypothetical protein